MSVGDVKMLVRFDCIAKAVNDVTSTVSEGNCTVIATKPLATGAVELTISGDLHKMLQLMRSLGYAAGEYEVSSS